MGARELDLERRLPVLTGRAWTFADGLAAADIVARLRESGLLTVAAGENVIRLLPPLIAEDAHFDEALAILEKTAATAKPAKP
jgi:acetylornithine/N-succinyldiaminopimelate aminotransferase